MINKKILKNFIDYKFFEFPPSPLKCFKTAFKFGLVGDKLTFNPCVMLSNKTSKFDKLLLGRILDSNYLILKDEVVKNICDGTLSRADEKTLLADFKQLHEMFVSVLIFPERDVTVFGESAPIDANIAQFLRKTEQDIRFVNLINSYFSYPIWARNFRKCTVSYLYKFEIKQSTYKKFTDEEFLDKLNGFMPSSATIYAKKYHPSMLSDKRALGLESVVYCCSNCGAMFDLYSEFSQLKCKTCGSATELDTNGAVLFSKQVKTLDELKVFQYNMLKSIDADDKKLLLGYTDVYKCVVFYDNSTAVSGKIDLEIYKNKIKLLSNNEEEVYLFRDIKHVELAFDNTLIIYLKNQKKIAICGKNNENLYVICDLFKIYNEK